MSTLSSSVFTSELFQSTGAIISPFTNSIVYTSVLTFGNFLEGVKSSGDNKLPSVSGVNLNFGSIKFSFGALANLILGKLFLLGFQ